MNKPLLLIFASALALGACNTKTGQNAAGQSRRKAPGSASTSAGWTSPRCRATTSTNMPTATGRHEIPADRSRIGGFWIADQVREKNTRELFDNILKSKPTSGTDALIANYYNAYLNTDAIDKAGIAPAKADLDAIARIADKKQLSAAIGSNIRADTDPLNATNFPTPNLFGIFVTQGLATPGEQLPYLMQGGLGLPDAQYYLSADPKMADTRNQYKAYIQTILQIAGYADPQGAAGRIMDLETKIAKAHEPREQSEDFANGAQVWTRAAARAEGAGDRLGVVAQRGAARQRAEVRRLSFRRDPEARRAGRIRAAAELEGLARFPPAISQAERPAQGVPRRQLRFLRNDAGGNAAAAAARQARAQCDQQRASGRRRQGLCRQIFPGLVQGRDPEDGRQHQGRVRQARPGDRLDGAVDQGRSAEEGRRTSSSASATPTPGAIIRAFRSRRQCLRQPEERARWPNTSTRSPRSASRSTASEWWMPPQLVNAVNLPVQNALNFPAAILVKPFFDPTADAAFNYGGIGATIGHEISHSFDNGGALFDASGATPQLVDAGGLQELQRPGRLRSPSSSTTMRRCPGCTSTAS